jgi:WD40 repeat protein
VHGSQLCLAPGTPHDRVTHPSFLWLLTAMLLVAGLVAACEGLLADQIVTVGGEDAHPKVARRTVAPNVSLEDEGEKLARTDRDGEPLPEEAICRLGTLLMRHSANLARFTQNRNMLLTQGKDGVRTWDITTGKQIYSLPKETTGGTWGAASLSADGSLLATASNSAIHIWDVATGQLAGALGAGGYRMACLSPDAKSVAATPTSDRNQVVLLDTQTGRQLWSWNAAESLVYLTFSPNGKALIVVRSTRLQRRSQKGTTIEFLDVETGKKLREIGLATVKLTKIAVSPDGLAVAGICNSKPGNPVIRDVHIWDLTTGRERFWRDPLTKERVGDRQRFFSAMAFTPDGKSLLAAGSEDALVQWDLATGKQLRRLSRHMTNPSDLAISQDGKRVAVASPGGVIRVIDRSNGEDLVPTAGHQQGINSTAVTPDGRTVATVSHGPSFTLWDQKTGEQRRRWEGAESSTYALASDGRTVISVKYGEKALTLWDSATGKELARLALNAFGEQPELMGIGPGGTVLAIGDRCQGTVHLMDSFTGKLLWSLGNPGLKVDHADFTSDGRTLVAFCEDHTAQVWDVITGTKLRQLGPMGDARSIICNQGPKGYEATLSPDGKCVAYGCANGPLINGDGSILLFDTPSGQELHRLDRLGGGPYVFAFSPDSRELAWSCWQDPAIHLLEVATGEERHSLIRHSGHIESLTFSADGKTLVSGSADTTALVWDLTGRLAAKGAWGKRLSLEDLESCWTSLAEDASSAYAAMQRLSAAPTQSIPYLEQRIHPIRPVQGKHLAKMIADLDSTQFSVRQKAAQELESLGVAAVAACRKALEDKPSLDAHVQLETLIKHSQEWRRSLHMLRALREIEALELANAPEANKWLERLSSGVPESRLTQEAKASLERLRKRQAVAR